jgi:hypothetical protein
MTKTTNQRRKVREMCKNSNFFARKSPLPWSRSVGFYA